ncbi:MAG TPA: hypothetical protein VFL13_01555 [Candidatus Baltobacteraceae bacterium]|nr:hypothetical protein [Candidatus Baltobacteraceae bacterium]
MNVLRIIARLLLGALFTLAGVMGFVTTPPPMPGMIGTLSNALYASHWDWFIAAAQLVAGVLLLTNRFTGFALIVIGAFMYNSFAFHITTSPQFLPLPIVVVLVWAFVAWPLRADYARLFTARITKEST